MAKNCSICMRPNTCDCLCATCQSAREQDKRTIKIQVIENYISEMPEAKSKALRKYAEAHGIEMIEVVLSQPQSFPSLASFISRWAKR